MLDYLQIKNLVLIDACEVTFEKGLHIITGETGAGKTALLHGLGLVLGERADSTLIRKGEEKGWVQASFSIDTLKAVQKILEEAGIHQEKGESLVITRELSKEGKSRAFVNNQLTSLSLLQTIGSHLIHLIGQHSYHELKSSDAPRSILDLYGDLQQELQQYVDAYTEEKALKEKLSLLQNQSAHKERELEHCQAQLQELESAGLKENEEEALFEEYSFFSKAQEIGEKSAGICSALSESPQAIIPQLARFKQTCDNLSSSHPLFKESSSLFQEALVSLQEISSCLQQKFSHLDHDPRRLQFLEERLSLLSKLKKKYGPTFAECMQQIEILRKKCAEWENVDLEIEQLAEKAKQAEESLQKLSRDLTAKRKHSASILQTKLTDEIQALNMIGAEVTIEIQTAPRSLSGEDHVVFWLKANKGEHPVSIKESSSGGELSRLLLAIKTTLAEKNNTPTIIFDEIDANVGGETATLIGEKLLELARYRQVFCITHFPQVASQAHLHFRVIKEESEGRTTARLEKLNKKEKEQELLRMLGGKKALPI